METSPKTEEVLVKKEEDVQKRRPRILKTESGQRG